MDSVIYYILNCSTCFLSHKCSLYHLVTRTQLYYLCEVALSPARAIYNNDADSPFGKLIMIGMSDYDVLV